MKGAVDRDSAAGAWARPRYWITSSRTIRLLADIDPDVARAVFGDPSAISLGDGFPNATRGIAFASLDAFETAVGADAVDPAVRVAMYDIEAWDATPLVERQHPIPSIARFTELARTKGYFVVITPHPGLMDVEGGDCVRVDVETVNGAYVRCDVAGRAATYADAVETQAQALEREPATYRRFVVATARQARAANPDVIVLAGLSTSPGYRATPAMLVDAAMSVDDVVDGFYLSLPRGRFPRVAVEFLRMYAVGRKRNGGGFPPPFHR